ncbi:MAG: corrinoid protein [Chloroflexi bacterium]|nr:corrinoid protein [Chloroflexota bacterium]
MDRILEEIYAAVIAGSRDEVAAGVAQALQGGLDASTILKQGLIPALREVGSRFERGECFVPEMLVSARAMQAGVAVLRPQLMRSESQSAGTVLVGTVQGDVHDIGKNLVVMMLEGAGYKVTDLGTNVAPARFVEAVRASNPDVVGMSALLTTTMPNMKVTIEALEKAGLRERVRVLVGGAPVTADFAKGIGADAFAPDASAAVRRVQELLNQT